MFDCPDCDKQYANQPTLNRHLQNHQKNKKYICQICHVCFYRRDLLSRHVKTIHQSPSSSTTRNSAPRAHEQRKNRGRQRCHTACIPCRAARVKCDGQQPCRSCANSDKTCEYSLLVNRISQAPLRETSLSDTDNRDAGQNGSGTSEEIQDNAQLDDHDRQTQPYYHMNPDGGVSADPSGAMSSPSSTAVLAFFNGAEESASTDEGNMIHPSSAEFTLPLPCGNYGFMNSNMSIDINDALMSDLTSDTTAWPWLHENIFLQPDSQVMWPEMGQQYLIPEAGDGDGDLNEAAYDETAHTLLQTSDNQHGLHSVEDTTSQANPAPKSSEVSLQPEEETVQQIQTYRGTDTQGRMQVSSVHKSDSTTPHQHKAIDDIVNRAAQSGWFHAAKTERSAYFASLSATVSGLFDLRNEQPSNSSHCLQLFLDLYLQHFHPLWPLLTRQGLDCDSLHPLLYLTLASIGAMYGGIQSGHVGTVLHGRLRQTLTAGLDLNNFDSNLVWLGQSRLLTQVAALYFGQPRAFSYAQHLGGILVAQARHMNLFTTPRSYSDEASTESQRPVSERLARWLFLEERRRLAFGILRAEAYTSVLLNTRPLVSPEEIDLELPCADSMWRGPPQSPEIFLAVVEQERASRTRQRFSDIVQVALERNEASFMLEPYGQELLLFGLQQSVWRFSHDPSIFARFTENMEGHIQSDYDGLVNYSDPPQNDRPNTNTSTNLQVPTRQSTGMMEDHLGAPPRRMENLRVDLDRLISALQKCRQSLQLIRNAIHLQHDRNSVLSSLLLYHLSYIRLQSPLEVMHQISYRTADKQPIEKRAIEEICEWANSRRAMVAAHHACTILSLICREVQRPVTTRVKFNFLVFAGLHHAAVVLWTLMGSCDGLVTSQESLVIQPLVALEPPMAVCRDNSQAILKLVSQVFTSISPGQWSSFSAASLRLSTCQFPRP